MADVDQTRVRRLVIVESPTKARKIAGYLGPNYVVESSRGHIRDLPKGAADVPAKYKAEKWARLGVNVDEDFEPLYVVSPDKKATVSELKNLLKGVDELYLAVRGAAPFADLPRASFDEVLNLLSGRYPSDDFSGLKARITWDRINQTLTPRRGAQRTAILNAGTIPDRGLPAS